VVRGEDAVRRYVQRALRARMTENRLTQKFRQSPLVERNTRFTMLIKILRKDTTTVVAALAKHIRKLPEELRRSLTWDQGKEMHAHKRFTVATNLQVYFCDPRSPWQRGSNENTNGLLRQYFPRRTDFSRISQSYLNAIALRLNQRPRKTLGFETPADRLQAALH
jgi:IS30 family transposase